MPSAFRYRGRDINTDRYLILHEEVEKTLIDQLGLHYLHAFKDNLARAVRGPLADTRLQPDARGRDGRTGGAQEWYHQ
jgi:hypothetical protein